MSRVLIIDDNEALCRTLTRKLEKATDHQVESVHTLADGVGSARAGDFDVVFLDVMMPDGSGLDVIPEIKKAPSRPEVIIITGKGEREGAALAIKAGAWDYVQKGSSIETLILPMARALQFREEKQRPSSTVSLKRDKIIGSSPAIARRLDMVAQAAASDANILITGETGVGKELFARAMHENSRRKEAAFVVLDCAAVPENLLESQLFGHEKGAFTGAEKARGGLVKEADGGTLFLDEIGELPMSFQKAFLRVLQERSFRPIGSAREIKSDFRLVAATNRDLKAMAERGEFRQDLLFRVNTIVLDIPPLRERPEDIKEIAMHYIAAACEKIGAAHKGFSPEFMDALLSYQWPGNVRELAHTIERAVTMAGPDSNLFPNFLPSAIRIAQAQTSLPAKAAGQAEPPPVASAEPPPGDDESLPPDVAGDPPTFKDFKRPRVDQIERQYITMLLEKTGGDMDLASQLSDLSKSRLYKLIKKHDMKK